MVNVIISDRVTTCEKVTLVTHSTAANSSLAAASYPNLLLSERVGKIVNLGPCMQINLDNFWLPVRDLTSIAAFYSSLKTAGVNSIFSDISDPDLQSYCTSDSFSTAICNAYILPAF